METKRTSEGLSHPSGGKGRDLLEHGGKATELEAPTNWGRQGRDLSEDGKKAT